jgi:hypothetical protein
LIPYISSCTHCPIRPLADYLDEVLRPLYDDNTQSTTFANGADFMQKILIYDHHLYAMVSHDRIIEAVGQFLSSVLTVG